MGCSEVEPLQRFSEADSLRFRLKIAFSFKIDLMMRNYIIFPNYVPANATADRSGGIFDWVNHERRITQWQEM